MAKGNSNLDEADSLADADHADLAPRVDHDQFSGRLPVRGFLGGRDAIRLLLLLLLVLVVQVQSTNA